MMAQLQQYLGESDTASLNQATQQPLLAKMKVYAGVIDLRQLNILLL